jgi:hypothetical protein
VTDRRLKPIEHDGVIYPSQTALAKALGLHRATVSRAVWLGKLDSLGKGSKNGLALATRNSAHVRCQPVSAHGWEWPSQKAAGEALGIKSSGVQGRLDRGTLGALVLQRLGVKE